MSDDPGDAVKVPGFRLHYNLKTTDLIRKEKNAYTRPVFVEKWSYTEWFSFRTLADHKVGYRAEIADTAYFQSCNLPYAFFLDINRFQMTSLTFYFISEFSLHDFQHANKYTLS